MSMAVNRRMGHVRLSCISSSCQASPKHTAARLQDCCVRASGVGNGAFVNLRHRPARAARRVAGHGKVAFQVLGPSFILPAGDASPLAAFFADAAAIPACSRCPAGAGMAGAGCARADRARRHAAVRARSSGASIRGALRTEPRVGRASDSGTADVTHASGAAGGDAGSSYLIRPGPATGDRTSSCCPRYRTGRRRRRGVGSSRPACPGQWMLDLRRPGLCRPQADCGERRRAGPGADRSGSGR